MVSSLAHRFAADVARSLRSDANVEFLVHGRGSVKSAFAVTDLAVGVLGAAGNELAALIAQVFASRPEVLVDRRMACLWFTWSLRANGWSLPDAWDSIAGNYKTADGWIRLHTNAAHHRAVVTRVLGFEDTNCDKLDVREAVASWKTVDLENAIVGSKGCAAEMRSLDDWAAHPQGLAVAGEPLIHVNFCEGSEARPLLGLADRPLAGLKVLDCTRVLAGPACTRFLAAFGADVLRIDPPWWDEPCCTEEMTLGKRCAALDLTRSEDRQKFEGLLLEADVFVHGYRSDALENLGLGFDRQRSLNTNLIIVAVNAYGWTGPWSTRRGFDSLVQMSCGLAHRGMAWAKSEEPVPLPFQALDHATGYIAAAAAIRGITERHKSGKVMYARVSLARVAKLLIDYSPSEDDDADFAPQNSTDFSEEIEATAWGPAQRLRPPMKIGDCAMRWDLPAGPLRASTAQFRHSMI